MIVTLVGVPQQLGVAAFGAMLTERLQQLGAQHAVAEVRAYAPRGRKLPYELGSYLFERKVLASAHSLQPWVIAGSAIGAILEIQTSQSGYHDVYLLEEYDAQAVCVAVTGHRSSNPIKTFQKGDKILPNITL